MQKQPKSYLCEGVDTKGKTKLLYRGLLLSAYTPRTVEVHNNHHTRARVRDINAFSKKNKLGVAIHFDTKGAMFITQSPTKVIHIMFPGSKSIKIKRLP